MTKTITFLPNAPKELVEHLRKTNSKSQNAILERLLTDPKMNNSWTLIGNRCSGAEAYWRLWMAIFDAWRKSRTRERSKDGAHKQTLWKSRGQELPRATMRKNFLRMAKDAEALAAMIDSSPLDRLAFDFFPDDQAQLAFTVKNWATLGYDERSDVADKHLAFWPAMTDLLEELARSATRRADAALTEKRLVDRETQEWALNCFVRHLVKHFREHLNGPMEGTLANIASVVFERTIDKKMVTQALRHEGGA